MPASLKNREAKIQALLRERKVAVAAIERVITALCAKRQCGERLISKETAEEFLKKLEQQPEEQVEEISLAS